MLERKRSGKQSQESPSPINIVIRRAGSKLEPTDISIQMDQSNPV